MEGSNIDPEILVLLPEGREIFFEAVVARRSDFEVRVKMLLQLLKFLFQALDLAAGPVVDEAPFFLSGLSPRDAIDRSGFPGCDHSGLEARQEYRDFGSPDTWDGMDVSANGAGQLFPDAQFAGMARLSCYLSKCS